MRRLPGPVARPRAVLACAAAAALAACAAPDPPETAQLVEPRVPLAVLGEGRWHHAHRAVADMNGDGSMETAVIMTDVEIGDDGQPIWEDGHHWQVYIEDGATGERTYVYARFLPHGSLQAHLAWPQQDAPPTIVLVERTPWSFAAHEVHYGGPGSAVSRVLAERPLRADSGFTALPLR